MCFYKKLFLIICVVISTFGCSSQSIPPGLHEFVLEKRIFVDEARVKFKLNKSGDSLFVHIYKPWKEDVDTKVKYKVNLYDKDQQLIQSITHQTKQKWQNVSMNFLMVDESNVDRVSYFFIEVSY